MSTNTYKHCVKFFDRNLNVLYVVEFTASSDQLPQFLFRNAVHEWLKTGEGTRLNRAAGNRFTIRHAKDAFTRKTLEPWGINALVIHEFHGPIFTDINIVIGHVDAENNPS